MDISKRRTHEFLLVKYALISYGISDILNRAEKRKFRVPNIVLEEVNHILSA
jgi:hypothetical protein